jgi:hypothetical protein
VRILVVLFAAFAFSEIAFVAERAGAASRPRVPAASGCAGVRALPVLAPLPARLQPRNRSAAATLC